MQKTKPCCCAPTTTWSSEHLTEPIVVGWLLALCFSGSLIGRRGGAEWDRGPLDHRPQDRIKWFPLLRWELLLPLREVPAPSQDYYFWQCLPQEGTFADLMGPGPLYTAFCMAACHLLHREGKEEVRDVCKKSKHDRPRLCDLKHRHYTDDRNLNDFKFAFTRFKCKSIVLCFLYETYPDVLNSKITLKQ